MSSSRMNTYEWDDDDDDDDDDDILTSLKESVMEVAGNNTSQISTTPSHAPASESQITNISTTPHPPATTPHE